jgi:hypothetical protein
VGVRGDSSSCAGEASTCDRGERAAVDFVKLIPLALAAAVYPTLLAGVILLLTRPDPLRLLVAFLAGGMAISVVAGFVLVQVLESSDFVSKSDSSSKPIADILIGAASLLVAAGVWSRHIKRGSRRRQPPEQQRGQKRRNSLTSRVLSRGSLTMAFIAGLVLNLPGVWYLDALVGIAKTKPSDASALLQILVFNVIMFALVELPIVAYLLDPDRASTLVNNFSHWFHRNSRPIAIVVALAVGLWLLTRGIVDLVK